MKLSRMEKPAGAMGKLISCILLALLLLYGAGIASGADVSSQLLSVSDSITNPSGLSLKGLGPESLASIL